MPVSISISTWTVRFDTTVNGFGLARRRRRFFVGGAQIDLL
jgi:hypothetical protein